WRFLGRPKYRSPEKSIQLTFAEISPHPPAPSPKGEGGMFAFASSCLSLSESGSGEGTFSSLGVVLFFRELVPRAVAVRSSAERDGDGVLARDVGERLCFFAAVGARRIDDVGDELAADDDHLVAVRNSGHDAVAGDAGLLEDLRVVQIVRRAVGRVAAPAHRL